MFTNRVPDFKEGNILKQDMLENLRDFPRGFFNLYFQDYSDGILAGCGLAVEDNYIYINEGIIKFKGIIYILNEASKIKYSTKNREVVMKVKFLNREETKNFKVYNGEVFLDEEINLAEDEFELGRFNLREGAMLRANYSNFADFSTEYNTINIINVKYANINKYTLHPLLVRTFANRLLMETEDSPLDISFAMECLNSRVVDRELIINYLTRKLGLKKEEYTNLEIYEYMQRILKGLSGRGTTPQKPKKDLGKIIVN